LRAAEAQNSNDVGIEKSMFWPFVNPWNLLLAFEISPRIVGLGPAAGGRFALLPAINYPGQARPRAGNVASCREPSVIFTGSPLSRECHNPARIPACAVARCKDARRRLRAGNAWVKFADRY
jgi:hypothetical protein